MVDSQKEIICPACGCEMQKIFVADKGINVDICTNGCGGIYLDNKEIQEFSSYNDNIEDIKQALKDKNFMPVDKSAKRICPSCKTPMVKTRALNTEIDTCYNCGSLFLDYGEFELIKGQFIKHKKSVPLDLNPKKEFTIEEYYKEVQEEKRKLKQNQKFYDKLFDLFRIFY